jgi:hypothetical protein
MNKCVSGNCIKTSVSEKNVAVPLFKIVFTLIDNEH